MSPSAAARTASRPISAPVGTRMRAPVSLARSTSSQFSSNCPTLSGMKTLPGLDRRACDGRGTALSASPQRRHRNAAASLPAQRWESRCRCAEDAALCFRDIAHRHRRERQTGNARFQARRATSNPTAPRPARPTRTHSNFPFSDIVRISSCDNSQLRSRAQVTSGYTDRTAQADRNALSFPQRGIAMSLSWSRCCGHARDVSGGLPQNGDSRS